MDVEEVMYSGHMMDELMDMVARAERHAEELRVAPEVVDAVEFYAPRYLYDSANQRALVGVA